MNSINESGIKLVPLIDMALVVLNRENQLAPLQHVIHNLWMGIFWLKTASESLEEYTKDTVTTGEGERKSDVIPVPTLFGTQEQLQFIKTSLESLTKDLDQTADSLSAIPSVQYKVQRSLDKVYEGLFNNDLAINYYQQITHARAGKK